MKINSSKTYRLLVRLLNALPRKGNNIFMAYASCNFLDQD